LAWFTAFVAFALATPALGAVRLDDLAAAPGVRDHSLELRNGWATAQRVADDEGDDADESGDDEAAFADRVSLAVLGEAHRLPGQARRLGGVGLESDVSLGRLPTLGGEASLHFEYRQHTRAAAAASQAGFSFAKTDGRFEGLIDLTLDRPIASRDDDQKDADGYSASATWRALGGLRLGVQALGGVGEDHGFKAGAHGVFVGPQVKWKSRPGRLPAELAVDAGWLAAIGEAGHGAAQQARVNLELKRKF
jgi:hypothetical protein